jgi:hypothetical protein
MELEMVKAYFKFFNIVILVLSIFIRHADNVHFQNSAILAKALRYTNLELEFEVIFLSKLYILFSSFNIEFQGLSRCSTHTG